MKTVAKTIQLIVCVFSLFVIRIRLHLQVEFAKLRFQIFIN